MHSTANFGYHSGGPGQGIIGAATTQFIGRIVHDLSSYSILFWITNCGKRPVTVKGFYASAVDRRTGFEEDICTDFSDGRGFVSLDIRLEEADIREMRALDAAWLDDEQSLSLSDIKVTVIDACGKHYEAKDPSDVWQRRFRRSVRRLTSQLRSLLRINKGWFWVDWALFA